jgi:nucleotide-binding universal stress UspA family protein
MMIRSLLVPVDFSLRSRPALEYAFALAEMTGADVDLLHVVPAPGKLHIAADIYLGRTAPEPSGADVLWAREALQQLIESCDRRAVVPRIHVAAGDPAATIVRVAAELPADLIVMGTRSRHGLSELAMGSVAQKVIACSTCPVIALGRELMQHVGEGVRP